jgi:hypothetical protein
MHDIKHCCICRPTVSEDAGIEPRTVATTTLTVRRSNHFARSYPQQDILSSKIGNAGDRRSLQPSKENIQHFKTWKFSSFFYICGSFLPFWIWIRILIQNVDPDPDPATQINADLCESGSTTLVSDPDSLNPDKIILLIRIRIHILNADPDPDPGGQNDLQIWKKVKNFHVLKCWMFSIEGWRLLL